MAKCFGKSLVLFAFIVADLFGYVSCVIVNVTRQGQDYFNRPVLVTSRCYYEEGDVCDRLNATTTESRKFGVMNKCYCECMQDFSTFVESKLRCVSNLKIRNKTADNRWKFRLPQEYGANSVVGVQDLSENRSKISFKINDYSNQLKECNLLDVETVNMSGNWTEVKKKLYTVKDRSVPVHLNNQSSSFEFSWKSRKNAEEYAGKIMRMHIKCDYADVKTMRKQKNIDDYLTFKVGGTVQVNISVVSPSASSTVTSVAQFKSSASSHSRDSTILPAPSVSSQSSTLLSSQKTTTINPTFKYSIVPTTSSYRHQASRTDALDLVSSSTPVNVLVSSMNSQSHQHQASRTDALRLVSSSTPVNILVSSMNSQSYQHTSSETKTKLSPSQTSPGSGQSSSVTSSVPEKQSNDSTVKTAVGSVVGVLLVLIIAVVLVYLLRKRKLKKRCGEQSLDGKVIKTPANVPLPTLSNPVFQEGAYENPQDAHKDEKYRSGIKSIQSALYDNCLVVENPSARGGIASVYDNIPEQKSENTYQDLDPAKRLPSNKYQSLVKPCNEYTTITDRGDGKHASEPVYSVLEDEPSKTSNLAPDTESKTPAVSEPVYNIIEPDDSNMPAETETEPVYNVLEKSTDSVGEREPVYPILEND